MVFPVVTYGCESWTIKKSECWRIDAFELWCWRRLLKVPWTARRSNQSILKEISPECSLEGLMLKLKLQCYGHLMLTHWKRPWCWERLKAGGEGDDGGWDGWMASLTQWTWVWVNSESWWWTGRPGTLQFMGHKELDTTEQLTHTYHQAPRRDHRQNILWHKSYQCILRSVSQGNAKNWLIGKDPNAGKDWRQEEKGVTEDEMVGWHHRLNGHEFE